MAHKQQNQGSGKQKQQGGAGHQGHHNQQQSQLDPADDAQRQNEPEKLHGDPIRTPGGDKPK